jgi:hypothetical protein
MSRFPAAFRPPAFASRSSDSRRGVGPSSRSAYRPRPDPEGVTAFRTHELRPGWVPPLPRGRRCSPRPSRLLDRRLPLPSGQSLHPAPTSHRAGLSLHEASTRVQAIHPSGLPLACSRPDGTGSPRAFPRASNPAGKHRRRTSRWGQAIEHGPGTTLTTSAEPPINVFTHMRATSRRKTSCERPPARSDPSRSCIGDEAVATR